MIDNYYKALVTVTVGRGENAYFRLDEYIQFFDSASYESLSMAWADLESRIRNIPKSAPIQISIWRGLRTPGPWRGLDEIKNQTIDHRTLRNADTSN